MRSGVTCSDCGAVAPPEAKFCGNCGCRLPLASGNSRSTGEDASDAARNTTGFASPLGAAIRQTHPWRRFWARTFDLFTGGLVAYTVCALFIMSIAPDWYAASSDILENRVVAGVLLYLAWVPVEAVFISTVATTPGKWLYGIRILSRMGGRLSFSDALARTASVWFRGDGLGIPLVTLVTRSIAYRRLVRTGSTSWDEALMSVVTHRRWGNVRKVAVVLLTGGALLAVLALNALAGPLMTVSAHQKVKFSERAPTTRTMGPP